MGGESEAESQELDKTEQTRTKDIEARKQSGLESSGVEEKEETGTEIGIVLASGNGRKKAELYSLAERRLR